MALILLFLNCLERIKLIPAFAIKVVLPDPLTPSNKYQGKLFRLDSLPCLLIKVFFKKETAPAKRPSKVCNFLVNSGLLIFATGAACAV